jgi:hypothetical protein
MPERDCVFRSLTEVKQNAIHQINIY